MENNKKQTAVEWLVEQLKERGYAGDFPPHLLFEQAKEMEKEQRGYSEEEVLEILCKSHNAEDTSTVSNRLKKWFEQLKKKEL
jgi:hypothetical protein